jgi:hypothetical protein
MDNQITYTRIGDFLIPDIIIQVPPEENVKPLSRYALLHQRFLKEHRTITYNTLLLKGKLFTHLREIDETARERRARGVSEEVILAELVYNY